jgi:hypothetical protein
MYVPADAGGSLPYAKKVLGANNDDIRAQGKASTGVTPPSAFGHRLSASSLGSICIAGEGATRHKRGDAKKKRPHFWGHPKEAREGGKVREGDAYQPHKQGRNGDVEIVRRGLKSFG